MTLEELVALAIRVGELQGRALCCQKLALRDAERKAWAAYYKLKNQLDVATKEYKSCTK